jgi:pyruvate/2-oxoglutarate dehydrogenase complex dihydrolipoamide dehydrogenase (E3) component
MEPRKTANDDAGSAAIETIAPDICVIGGGSGGLSVASAAAAFGRSVVLIEKHKMGGDCLNYGCVPSKALIAAGRRAHTMRTSQAFGIEPVDPVVDFSAVHRHVHSVIAAIAPNDSIERFQGLGVRVIQAVARFADAGTVVAGDHRITARRFVIATGSSPMVPPIPGLSQVSYLTNETLFDNTVRPDHLVIIGGGPIGMEMAQAHRRLGSRVTVIEGAKALGKDDPEMTALLLGLIRAEGVEVREGTLVERVEPLMQGMRVHLKASGGEGADYVDASHLLVAAGRRPNIADLNLAAAGIKSGKAGIEVDRGLRTTNKKVFAIGDVAGGLQFTHVANYHAGIVIRRALFRLPAKAYTRHVPWVTYTEPELAHVGLSEPEALAQNIKIRVLRWPFHENDRAQAERETAGHVKVVTDPKGRILGATILGAQAGELIQMWSLAIAQGLNIKAMTAWVSPYPTLSEVNKRVAYRFFVDKAGNPLLRRIIGWLAKLG